MAHGLSRYLLIIEDGDRVVASRYLQFYSAFRDTSYSGTEHYVTRGVIRYSARSNRLVACGRALPVHPLIILVSLCLLFGAPCKAHETLSVRTAGPSVRITMDFALN